MPTPVVPSLTVALPTFNGTRHLAEALRSVRAQEGLAFDLLICDDRSEDDTVSLVREEVGDRARIEVNSERLGLARNWNRCIEQSRTPLVAVFHQDDVMHPGHLVRHGEAFRRPEPIGFVCGAVEILDDHGDSVPPTVIDRPDLGPDDRLFPPGAFVAELVTSNPVRCSAVTIRKEAHADVGGFDPSYRFAVDWEFWQRLARRWAVCWLARPTVGVRWHPGSETQRFRRGTDDLEEVARVVEMILRLDEGAIPDASRKRQEASRHLSRAYLNRAYEGFRAGDPALARRCLGRSIRHWKGILGTIARDPKLALLSAALGIAPVSTARWMASRSSTGDRIKNPSA